MKTLRDCLDIALQQTFPAHLRIQVDGGGPAPGPHDWYVHVDNGTAQERADVLLYANAYSSGWIAHLTADGEAK